MTLMTGRNAAQKIFDAGGEIDISLANAEELEQINQAVADGLVTVEIAGWGDRTIALLTKKGRKVTRGPKQTLLQTIIAYLRLPTMR